MTGPTEPEGQSKPFEPMPSAPAVNEQELAQVPAGPRPKSVDNAFLLWIISAGISLIGIILTLTLGSDDLKDAARTSLESQNRSFTEQDVENVANASMIIALVVGLIFLGLYVLFAYKMRAGRNWARITLAVLGGLSIVFTLFSLSQADAISMVVGFGQAVLILVAVYFMFRPDANQYFAAGKVRR